MECKSDLFARTSASPMISVRLRTVEPEPANFTLSGMLRVRSWPCMRLKITNALIRTKGPVFQAAFIRILENGEEKSTDIELDHETAEDMFNGHGRKTEFFSSGWAFLELFGGRIDEKLPLDMPKCQPSKKIPMFVRYVPQLQTWARRLQASDSGHELAPLFKIASDMISTNPKIDQQWMTSLRELLPIEAKTFVTSAGQRKTDQITTNQITTTQITTNQITTNQITTNRILRTLKGD